MNPTRDAILWTGICSASNAMFADSRLGAAAVVLLALAIHQGLIPLVNLSHSNRCTSNRCTITIQTYRYKLISISNCVFSFQSSRVIQMFVFGFGSCRLLAINSSALFSFEECRLLAKIYCFVFPWRLSSASE